MTLNAHGQKKRLVRYWVIMVGRGGYVLEVWPDEVSTHRRYVGAGRAQQLVGEYRTREEAEEALQEALSSSLLRKQWHQ